MSNKMFFKTVESMPEKAKRQSPLSWKKVFLPIFGLILVVLIIGFVALQANGVISQFKTSWNEIKFAYEKPSLVKVIRESYEEKHARLDAAFLQQATAEASLKTTPSVEVSELPEPTQAVQARSKF